MSVKTVLTSDLQADEEREMEEKLQLHDSQLGLAIGEYGPKGRGIYATSRVSVIFDDLSPTHRRLPISSLIDIPKDLNSKMSLEVA